MNKDWDLNIFFREDYNVDADETTWDDVITINPVLYMYDHERSDNHYTDILWTTTFAEARYLRSVYPENEYGMDWTDSISNFLEIAPPRLKALAMTLPNAYEYKPSLVG
jgi:hypothetical protein